MTILTRTTSITLIAIGLSFIFCYGQTISAGRTSTSRKANIKNGNIVLDIGRNIRCIFQDKNGSYWFGSDGQGLYQTFRTISDKQKFQFGIAETTSEEWKKQPEDIWFAAKDGVYRYDGHSLSNLHLPKTNLDAAYYAKFATGAISPYGIYNIFKDSKGDVWFGTEYLGVCRYDGKSFTWFNEKGLGGAAVRAIFEDKKGNFWFSNNGFGVFFYNGKTLINFTAEKGLGRPEYIQALKDGKFALARALGAKDNLASVMSMSDDRNGELWIGTYEAGLWRYDGKTVTNYTVKDGLPSNAIMAIYKDKKGELWFGTQGGGVCKFNGKIFTRFTIE